MIDRLPDSLSAVTFGDDDTGTGGADLRPQQSQPGLTARGMHDRELPAVSQAAMRARVNIIFGGGTNTQNWGYLG